MYLFCFCEEECLRRKERIRMVETGGVGWSFEEKVDLIFSKLSLCGIDDFGEYR